MTSQKTQSSISTRRNDVDWLRVLAVLLLVPFHAALVFVLNPNSIVYIKDTVNSSFLDHMDGFIHQFHMPLLFALAGMSTAFALGKRSVTQYLNERGLRLLAPFLFGLAVLVPPMTYITQIAAGKTLTIWQHYANFFTIGPDLSGIQGTLTPAHLWFIMYLLLFSLVGLPVFLLLKSKGSQPAISAMGRFFEKRFALLLLVIPLAMGAAPDILGDKNPIYYFLIFICGFVLVTDSRYQKAIDRDWPIYLGLGVVLEIVRQTWNPGFPQWSAQWLAYGLIVEQLTRWILVLAILGMGHRWLNRRSPALNYLSEAAYPFYILHLLVLTAVSYTVIQIETVIAIKYFLIVLATYGFTFLIYEGAKRVSALRFLLGMKTHLKPAVIPAGATAPHN